MTLEDYVAHLNGSAFWREFSFSRSKFSPQPGKEFELADNFVWIGDHAYVLQLKEREEATDNPDIERTWFAKKVIKKATSQIRDSLRYLAENPAIRLTNERGHGFDVRRADLVTITKIVVYLPGQVLPDNCRNTRFHLSKSSGDFIHILPASDYLGILDTLRVPEDIARYFAYRESVAPPLRAAGVDADEADIMGGFLEELALPTMRSHEVLQRLVQDLDAFDLSGLLANIHDNIERATNPFDYYRILQEFARLPRSVWREVKLRLNKSLEATAEKRFTQPFRLTFPETDCTIMIAPLMPELPATGPEGEKVRVAGLTNLTHGAKYLAKTSKGIGILVSRDGDYVQIDWSLIEEPWRENPEMEAWLANSNPFRAVRERSVDGFLLFTRPPGAP